MKLFFRHLAVGFVLGLLAAGCGKQKELDRDRSHPEIDGTKPASYQRQLDKATALWCRREDGVVVTRVVLPTGSVIQVARGYSMDFPDYLDTDGKIKRPSEPFLFPVTVLSVPASSTISAAEIEALNATEQGLLVSQPSPDWPSR